MTSAVDTELAALIASLRIEQPPAAPAPAEPRCTVTELLVSACSHCRPAAEEPSRLGPWISATYRGRCGNCGTTIEELDDIRADGDGGWLCFGCGQAAEKPATTPTLDGLIAPPSTASEIAPAVATLVGPALTGPPPSTVAEMREVLGDLDASRPRSQQVRLGPSELGTPCQRQIAMKLAGVTRQPEDKRPPWAPMQGTAMHGLMEEALRFHNAQLGRERWLVEEALVVDPGLPDVDPITGHGDAYDQDHGMVVDWKYVGVTALREVKRKTIPNEQLVKPEYRVQAHLYGRGHERAGRDVRYVRLVFLARSHDYSDSAEWTEPYKPEIAEWAVDRFYATHDLIGTHGLDLANNPELWPAVPATPGKACDWCPFRRVGGPADATGCPGNTDQKITTQLRGLIA
ncbi:hypothetical protein [Micromonospora chersina]|uniref:hypothetical protein n=1 Tax=Micromonospora chersina TaxID=47854 RepID=UPI0033FADA0A